MFYKQCKWETLYTLNLEEKNFKSEKDVKLLARRMSSGYLRSLQKLKSSSFRQESVFTRITDPLSNLRRIETNCDPQTIGEILRSISQAVEGDLLPVLETITMFLTFQKLPSTTQDIQLYLDKLNTSADKAISEEFCDLRRMLLEHGPLTESQVSALVSCVDHPKNQRISIVDKSLGPTAVADPREAPPYGPKFHAVFGKIRLICMLALPPRSWRPLLRGILYPPLNST